MLNQLLDLIKPYLPGVDSDETAQVDSEALKAEEAALRRAQEQQRLHRIAQEKVQLFQKLLAEAMGSLQGGSTGPSTSGLQGIGTVARTGNVRGSGSIFKSPRPLLQPIPPDRISQFMQMHVLASNYGINHLPPEQRGSYVKFRNDWLVSWHNFPPAQKAMYHREHMTAANEFKKTEQKEWDPQPPRKRGRRQKEVHPDPQKHPLLKNQFSENRNFFNM